MYLFYQTNHGEKTGRYCVLIALCSAAVLRPSVLGGLYFIVFLSSATWWACYKQLRRGFAIVLGCLIPVIFIHLSALYSYQFQWPQEFLERNSTYARYLKHAHTTEIDNLPSRSFCREEACAEEVTHSKTQDTQPIWEECQSPPARFELATYFGLTQLITISPNSPKDPRNLVYTDEEWASYINPIALYLLYYIVVLETKGLLKPESQKKQGPFSRLEGSFSGQLGRQMSQRLSRRQLMRSVTTKKRWRSATRKVRIKIKEPVAKEQQIQISESTPLIQGVSPSKRYGSGRKSGIFQDSTGSVTVTGENTEDIPLDELGGVFPNNVFPVKSYSTTNKL
ncbi:hypothetical protein NQ315_003650 [Exocentrus adspersus]|uniref:Piezo TM1-24 domain-containing protein n=1 Tax=Exocentrus adspersus TaxID=1586481 RepID=A0AAV8VCL8_9CUCU|nr:hypothetical protein NQ315_003650 [Exocentrus adspersus]